MKQLLTACFIRLYRVCSFIKQEEESLANEEQVLVKLNKKEDVSFAKLHLTSSSVICLRSAAVRFGCRTQKKTERKP